MDMEIDIDIDLDLDLGSDLARDEDKDERLNPFVSEHKYAMDNDATNGKKRIIIGRSRRGSAVG